VLGLGDVLVFGLNLQFRQVQYPDIKLGSIAQRARESAPWSRVGVIDRQRDIYQRCFKDDISIGIANLAISERDSRLRIAQPGD